jgi:glycogen debranching enzyme
MLKPLHEGTSFLISDQLGNIHADEEKQSGLFYEDSRFLSHYQLTLDGSLPVFLSSEGISESERRFFLSNGLMSKGKSRLLQDSLVIVRTQSLRQGFHERIEVTHHGDGTAYFNLEISVGADFEHIYFVKQSSESGQSSLPKHQIRRKIQNRGHSAELLFESDPVYRKCTLDFSQKPDWKSRCAHFHLTLKKDQCWVLDVDAEMICRKEKSEQKQIFEHQKSLSYMRERKAKRKLKEAIPILETDHVLLKRAFEAACQDLISLRMKATQARTHAPAIAAGIPWYMALFGRDSLITSCQSLWMDPLLAQGTLRSLAYFQGKKHDQVALEDPGKILHEYRESLIAGAHKAIPKFPYYGSVDSTPLFVIALSEYCRWTGDLSLAKELWPNVEAALQWMRNEGAPGRDGFLEYSSQDGGLTNQGWKDSVDSVRFSDGKIAQSPISLVEVQGYKIAALRRAAELAGYLKEGATVSICVSEAETLEANLLDWFWIKRKSFFAEALDHSKGQVDSATSNPGHLLWCESIPQSYAVKVAQRLFKPDLFNGYGIRTMGEREGGYNPVSYHNGSVWPHDNSLILAGLMNYGLRSHAKRLSEALLSALECAPDSRFSELFSGFSRKEFQTVVGYPSACKPQAWAAGAVIMMLRQILGIGANALEGVFEINPLPLKGMTYLRLRGLHFDRKTVDIDAHLRGKHFVVHVSRPDHLAKWKKSA